MLPISDKITPTFSYLHVVIYSHMYILFPKHNLEHNFYLFKKHNFVFVSHKNVYWYFYPCVNNTTTFLHTYINLLYML